MAGSRKACRTWRPPGVQASKLMPHRDFLEAARTEKSDITLSALCDRLWSERGVKADTSMMSRFFRRLSVTFKKDACRARAGPPGHQPPSRALASLSGPHRSQAIGVHRRDLDENQHDPASRMGAERRAPRRQGSAWPLEDRDISCRLAQRPHRCALPVRRAHQRRTLPRLCRTVPRSDPQAGRCRDPRQSRLHKRKAARKAIRDVGARLVFLPKYSPDLNPIEQVFAKFKTSAAKGRSPNIRRCRRRKRSYSRSIPARRMRRLCEERRIRIKPNAGYSRLPSTGGHARAR